MRSVDDQVRQASAEASVQSSETIENLRIKVVRLEANIRELFDAMTAGGGNRARTPENSERLVAAWAVLRETNAAAKEQV